MKEMLFAANVRQMPNTAILDLRGEINASAEPALNQAYEQADAQNPGVIMLNFKDVSYINSTGIALIVGLLAKARKSRRQMRVFGLSDHYIEIFQITRLADFMSIHQDEDSAIQAM